MTARTLPITPRVGLSLVHQPTTRAGAELPVAASSLRTLLTRLTAWWRRNGTLQVHWEERDRLRQVPLYVDSYTWLPRPQHAGGRHDW